MSSGADFGLPQTGQLRPRQKADIAPDIHVTAEDVPERTVLVGNEEHAKGQKTFGRTPDGTVFVVPTTHDMVSQLLDPRQPKNLSDAAVIAVLILHCVLAYALPASWKLPICASVFLFWRACYNIGIGILLNLQSNHRRLISWAQRWKLFQEPATGNNPRPWLYHLLKRELEAKIPEDYRMEKAPIEYNTWLVFRRVVDLILMCDFVSYCLFAIVCARQPESESIFMVMSRWGIGIALFGFNLWVKLDAHRVVKDFAWYWGDFFYLIDQDLTFDGVFELAPHPMYSIGYAGYYGISMMAASYEVLFISIVAHLAQFAFLVIVESPHIDKIYNPPPPRRRAEPWLATHVHQIEPEGETPNAAKSAGRSQNSPVHDMVGFNNMDLFRVPDCMVVVLPLYLATLCLASPSTAAWQAGFIAHALAWRVWYHLGLGLLLQQQSQNKLWTRHFLKYGETVGEAWRQWKGMHHISMIMCNASFVAACWKVYAPPEDWTLGLVLLKHVLGGSLVALQLWTAFSVYDSLGEFGWFSGDFFFDSQAQLTYTSIYRFLNNPERFFGLAGVWGAALITWNGAIFVNALTAQILTMYFIAYVEQPHMQKIYGRSLRDEAGLTKFIKKSLPPGVRGWQQSVDKVLDETTQFVEEFLDNARPKLASGVKTVMRDTTALLNLSPARLTVSRIPLDLAGLDPKQYSLTVSGSQLAATASADHATDKESFLGRFPKTVKTMTFEYGTPLKVKWRAPANHSKKDWVGLYMVTDNRSRDVTEVSSLGRWAPTNEGSYDAMTADSSIVEREHAIGKSSLEDENTTVEGVVEFKGDKLWWTQGVFEFRYHHDGKHNVMSVSEPFEIRIGRFDDQQMETQSKEAGEQLISNALLPVVQNCLDRDPDIAPDSFDEPFGGHVQRDGKYARRVVYAIHELFGIEFAPAVVKADGNVKKLAWRLRNAKAVLAPYSMSSSTKGTATPSLQEHSPIRGQFSE